MQTIFEVLSFHCPSELYESDWEGSLGIAGSLEQAVTAIARAKGDPYLMMTVESEDGTSGVYIRERMLGQFSCEVGKDTVATYDWRGERIE